MPLCHERLHLLFVVFARLPYNLHLVPGAQCIGMAFHRFVKRACAEAAAHYQYRGDVGFQPEMGCGFRPRCGLAEVPPERIAGEEDTVGGEETLHPFVGDADAVGPAREYLVGHAGIGVLFLNQGGDSHVLCRPKDRGAGISAETGRRIGPEGAYRAPGFADAFHHLEGQGEVPEVEFAL